MYANFQRGLVPKHALRVLNELRPGGLTFAIVEKIGSGWKTSVDLDGKTFTGNGPNLSKAKQQASEKVLRHIMRKQLAKLQSAESTDDNVDNDCTTKENGLAMEIDTTGREEGELSPPRKKRKSESAKDKFPWDCLISFALYKLFEEWYREEALSDSTEDLCDDCNETQTANIFEDSLSISIPFQTNYLTPFNCTRNPMKKIPEDATREHPVMLLNQLKPNIEYKVTFDESSQPNAFKVSVEVGGHEYVGQGRTKKDAKKMAAEAALVPLGIVYEYDSN